MRMSRFTLALIILGVLALDAPRASAQSGAHHYLFAPSFSSNNVTVFDLETGALVKSIPLQAKGACCAYATPDGSKVFITDGLSPYVTIINTRTLSVEHVTKLVDRWGDRGTPVQRDGKVFWTSEIFSGHVQGIDTATGEVLHTYLGIGNNFAASFDGNTLYTATSTGGLLSGDPGTLTFTTRSTQTGEILGQTEITSVGGGPVALLPTHDDTKVYIQTIGAGTPMHVMDVSDPRKPRYLHSIQVGPATFVGGFNDDSSQLWIGASGNGDVTIVDVKTDTPIHTIKTGQYVGNVVVSGNRAYVSISPFPYPPTPGKSLIATIVGIIPGAALTPPDTGSTRYRPGVDMPGEIQIYDTDTYARLPGPALPLPSVSFGMVAVQVPAHMNTQE
jgi:DNA-binding beta-propeller fold protein YncE